MIRAEVAAAHERLLSVINSRFDDAIWATRHASRTQTDEMELVLGSMVRELARLQMQVEVLQGLVRESGPTRNGLTLIDEAGEGHYLDAARHEDIMKVG